MILKIWSALSSTIYSEVAFFFAPNHTSFQTNEKALKQDKQSDFKAF